MTAKDAQRIYKIIEKACGGIEHAQHIPGFLDLSQRAKDDVATAKSNLISALRDLSRTLT